MKILNLCVISFLCSSCGIHSDHFDCPPKKGFGCKSISEVNDIVNQSTLNEEGQLELAEGNFKDCDTSSKLCRVSKNLRKYDPITDAPRMTNEFPGSIKIWFAPYKDDEGNYFEENVVFSKINKTESTGEI